HRSNAEWKSTGTQRRRHIGQQSSKCPHMSMSIRSGPASVWSTPAPAKHNLYVDEIRRNIRMYSQSKSGLGRLVAMLPAMIIFACASATLAAAQDRPVPKWQLYSGYFVFDLAADVHRQRPATLLPLSSRINTNPIG